MDSEEKTKEAELARARENRLDAETSYEALAVTGSMGMLGMEEETSKLIQLALAEELLYKFSIDEKTD